MAQTKRAYEEAKIPFAKMTFSPDVPSTALGPNEYNSGLNIETDIRGIRSASGDEVVLPSIPGTPTYVTGGYRRPQPGKEGNDFYYIVATVEGYWYASNGLGAWQQINPEGQVFSTYSQATNITDSWNGTVPFFNDEANPPMFWPEFTGTSLPTLTASSAAGTSTITFPTQADTLAGVSIVDAAGVFEFNGATTLKTGQRVDIAGVNTNASQYRLHDVEILNADGEFRFDDISQDAEFIGRIDDGTAPGAGTVLTVSSVTAGVMYNGMIIQYTVGATTYTNKITAFVSGSNTGPGVWTVKTSTEVAAGTAFTGALEFALVPGQSVTVTGTNTSTPTVLTGVLITDINGNFSSDATTLQAGQSVTVSGTISSAPEVLSTVKMTGLGGEFTCAATVAPLYSGQSVEVSGAITTPAVTLNTILITSPTGTFSCATTTLETGQVVTVSGINTNTLAQSLSTVTIVSNDGDFTCGNASLFVGQNVVVNGNNTATGFGLGSIVTTGTAGQFSCAASSSPIVAGQSVTVNGADTGFAITGAVIAGIGGQFTCSASTSLLVIGQFVTISGALTGTGSITGYVNPTTYAISTTNGSTAFTLTDTSGGAIVTAPGTTTGLNLNNNTQTIFGYSAPSTYAVSLTNGSTTFTLTTPGGAALVTNPGTPLSTAYSVNAPGITGYANPKTYLISATNGFNSFTLTDTAGNPLSTSLGVATGLVYTVQSPQITSYSNPTSYVISATNGTTEFILNTLAGGPVATRAGRPQNLTFTLEAAQITDYFDPTTYIINTTDGSTTFTLVTDSGQTVATYGGSAAGLVFTVLASSIDGYTNPTTYQITANNGTSTFKLVNLTTYTPITTTGGATTGLTFTLLGSGITGYTDPDTYYIKQTDGATYFQLEDAAGTVLTTVGGVVSGLIFRPQPPSITGYTNPSSYYITAVNSNNQFTLSSTPGGTAIATNAGTPVGLTYTYSPFGIGQQLLVEGIVPVGFRGTKTITGVSMNSVSFAGSTAGPQTVTGAVSDPYPLIIPYSNAVPLDLTDIATDPTNTNNQVITLEIAQTAAPYVAGEQIIISGVNNYFNGIFTVVSSTLTTITYKGIPGANYPGGSGTVSALYTWNYNPNWSKLYAKFMRIYNTPNVGSILVAGGLTATSLDGTTEEYPVTVRWSQAFGLNEAPKTWEPTVTNVANELEVPLRGAVVDAFPCNGQLFLCSVWDTVVFSPLNYSTTSAPILGVRLSNQGRGMLTANCWANTDKLVYGLDARDIWVFDGQDFKGLGNQRVKNWFYDQIDPEYVDRVFMETNTQKNQVEIYYPTKPPIVSDISIVSTDGKFKCLVQNSGFSGIVHDGLSVRLSGVETGTGSITGYNSAGTTYYVVDVNAAGDEFQLSATDQGSAITTTVGTVTGVAFDFTSNGVPNQMLAYRHDLDCFNAPREVQAATLACEGPFFNSQALYQNVAGTVLTGTGSGAKFSILRNNSAYQGYPQPNVRGSGYVVGDTIKILGTALGGETPVNDAVLTVATTDGNGKVLTFTAVGEPLDTWTYNDGLRTVVYARGLNNRTLVQKDDGYNFLGPQTRPYVINSLFRRDNIKILEDYSGKLLVHRILPEINNLNAANLPVMPGFQSGQRTGTVSVRLEGANSVGQTALQTTAETIATNSDYPWVQISQNAHRVNSIELSNSSSENIWICSASTWQYTQTEDDR